MCTLCDSANINTITVFVPNCLWHVSVDGLNGDSDSYLQFRDTCGKRRKININIYIYIYTHTHTHTHTYIYIYIYIYIHTPISSVLCTTRC